jgi:hypothetical protein
MSRGTERSGHVHYRCNTAYHAARLPCKTYSIRTDAIEPYIISLLQQILLSEQNLTRIEARLREERKKLTKGGSDIRALERVLAKLDQKIQTGTQNLLLAPKDLLSDASAVLSQWRAQRRQAARQLQAMRDARDRRQPDIRETIVRLRDLRELLEDADPASARRVIREVFDRITLYFEDAPKTKKGMDPKLRKVAVRRLREGVITFKPPLDSTPDVTFTREDVTLLERPTRTVRATARTVCEMYKGEPVHLRHFAAELGITISAAKGRLYRARKWGLIKASGVGCHAGWIPVAPTNGCESEAG